MSLRQRVLLACGLSAVLLLSAVAYVVIAGHRYSAPAAATAPVDASPGPRILFRSTAPGSYGRVATVAAGDRRVSGVSCDRVHAAAGSVICLRPDGPLATYQLAVLDARLREVRTYPLVGVPNRARVSPTGHLLAWTVRTLADNVECPSLSPDGTRVAFKSAVGGDPSRGWRLSVLDLASRRRTPLAETRSVDDQAAWRGDGEVMYAVRRGARSADGWSVRADGSGAPALLIPDAESPAALSG